MLNDEGLRSIAREEGKWLDSMEIYRAICQATTKKVIEWGDDFCSDLSHKGYTRTHTKKRCPKCWQELKDKYKGVE